MASGEVEKDKDRDREARSEPASPSLDEPTKRRKRLEAEIELVKMDAQARIDTREQKILELKRKIDQLEFAMENMTVKERRSEKERRDLEERLARTMETLRSSMRTLESNPDRGDGDGRSGGGPSGG